QSELAEPDVRQRDKTKSLQIEQQARIDDDARIADVLHALTSRLRQVARHGHLLIENEPTRRAYAAMDEGVARRGGNDVALRWRTRSAGCGQWRRRLDERAESTPRARQVPGRHRQMRQGLLRRSRWGGLREWRVLRSTA